MGGERDLVTGSLGWVLGLKFRGVSAGETYHSTWATRTEEVVESVTVGMGVGDLLSQ
jgi:hypothetical protein